jgi:hypothetical protein
VLHGLLAVTPGLVIPAEAGIQQETQTRFPLSRE